MALVGWSAATKSLAGGCQDASAAIASLGKIPRQPPIDFLQSIDQVGARPAETAIAIEEQHLSPPHRAQLGPIPRFGNPHKLFFGAMGIQTTAGHQQAIRRNSAKTHSARG